MLGHGGDLGTEERHAWSGLWLATFATVFCCAPVGWVALVLIFEAHRSALGAEGGRATWITRLAGIVSLVAVFAGGVQWTLFLLYAAWSRGLL